MPISGDAATFTPVPGKPALLLGAFDIASVGYVAEEFFISGTASSYSSVAELDHGFIVDTYYNPNGPATVKDKKLGETSIGGELFQVH